ncbi:very short patch repair endonuclease [Actinomadura sp. 21ATH]|uniref:very short patch repair endonuclease n=1 Tax=Actinomadura sp. 21ATH TaxID=1735444 RepID=UPI0035C1D11C
MSGSGAKQRGVAPREVTAEAWIPTAEGAHLRGRRTRDTKPEVELRRAVHGLGLRFRLHQRLAGRCTPDFVLPRWRLAVFVDGCFWHGCPKHSPTKFRGPNAAKWEHKLAVNRARDERNNALLAEAGWRVLRVWECEIKADLQDAAGRVATTARNLDLRAYGRQ